MKQYLSVGTKYTDTDEKKKVLDQAISEIEWHSKDEGKITFGYMQGAGLTELIKSYGHNVDRFGYAGYFGNSCGVDINGGFVYGIRNNYSKGEIRQVIAYFLDDGVALTPVLVDENPEGHKFDEINRPDFYSDTNKERTKKRLTQIADLGMEEVGVAQFGVPGIVSGLYIEKVWKDSDNEFNEYLEFVQEMIERTEKFKRENDICNPDNF